MNKSKAASNEHHIGQMNQHIKRLEDELEDQKKIANIHLKDWAKEENKNIKLEIENERLNENCRLALDQAMSNGERGLELRREIDALEQYGWKWCKEELPEEGSFCLCANKNGGIFSIKFMYHLITPEELCEMHGITQWYKCPKPMEEKQ